jgi:hypothetical protein
MIRPDYLGDGGHRETFDHRTIDLPPAVIRELTRRHAAEKLRWLQLAGVEHRKGTTTPWT